MDQIPKSVAELKTEAFGLGLLKPNPIIDTPRKELLSSIYSSCLIGRSIAQASLLIVGSSGVGKSSTINNLFNYNIAETSNKTSRTRCTSEYKLIGNYKTYKVKNLELGIVDSPGLNDTSGTKQDACNLFSIKRFYNDHPNLKGCYPNLIFIMVQATDTRIMGTNSNLSKSLKCLKLLNLVDTKHPNVVGILTWSCAIAGHGKRWQQKIDDKKEILGNMISTLLCVSAPIIAIENDIEDNELEIEGDYSRLPNGVLQPKNLYKACTGLLSKNKDKLGHIIFNACFLKANTSRIGFQTTANDASKYKLSAEEEKLFRQFEGAIQDGLKTQSVCDTHVLNEKENSFKMQLNEIQIETGDLCIAPREIQKKISDTMMVQNSPVNIDSPSIIGQGYNIRKDKIVPSQILEINVIDARYGVQIPAFAKIEKITESRSFMDEFEDDIAMAKSRVSQLGIGISIDYSLCNFQNRAGTTVKTSSKSQRHSSEVSFLQEERLFKLKMSNYKAEHVKFTQDFKDAVENLPKKFDANNPSDIRIHERFFDRWGHFIVSGAYGGGSVESKISSQIISEGQMSFRQLKTKMATVFNDGVSNINAHSSIAQVSTKELKMKKILSSSTFKWVAGDRKLHSKNTIENPETMKKWKISLEENAAMLETNLDLEPISTVVACISPDKEESTYCAIEHLLGEAKTRESTITDPKSSNECFPSSAKVTVFHKNKISEKNMSNLNVGDLVLSSKMESKNQTFSRVIMFAHCNRSAISEYLCITLENGKQIKISRNHLILVGEEKRMMMAEELRKGNFLLTDTQERVKVVDITQVVEKGIFCPITYEGTIFVNNILVSCYASVENYAIFNKSYIMTGHNLAHLGLLPMRMWYKLAINTKRNKKSNEGKNKVSEMHPYIRWLCKLKLPWMVKS